MYRQLRTTNFIRKFAVPVPDDFLIALNGAPLLLRRRHCFASSAIRTTMLSNRFWATVCKTVRHVLSYRCLFVCLSCMSCHVCPVFDVGVLWPNGCMDQYETWHAGTGLGPGHIVSDGDPAFPPPKGAETPIFGPYLLWPNG